MSGFQAVHAGGATVRGSRDDLAELKQRLAEISDLQAAAAVLAWDQSAFMPPGGAAARGRQLATLNHVAHERLVAPVIGRLLDRLEGSTRGLPPDSDDVRLLAVARRNYDRATRVPSGFLARMSEHSAASHQVWMRARPDNDFPAIAPYLATTVELCREYADFFPGAAHIADPLIDESDEGMSVGRLRPIFARLRESLRPLVDAVTKRPAADDEVLHRGFDAEDQLAYALELAGAFGFDPRRGRLDLAQHPFATRFSNRDVRMTTRVRTDDLSEVVYSTLHETGHALYELGVADALEGSPLAGGTSSGVHESQSRLWENLVGRSRAFWSFALPPLQRRFPGRLDDVDVETLYRAVNRVVPSLIRTDADELTYNLHVMIRFELEASLLDGSLTVSALPDAWNAAYEADLGIVPASDTVGVLQDVHWFWGPIGGEFQGYTLGNVLSAQFFAAAEAELGPLDEDFAAGRFQRLRGWLAQNVYQHGCKFPAEELVQRSTGRPMATDDYVRYLRRKYGDLYGLAT